MSMQMSFLCQQHRNAWIIQLAVGPNLEPTGNPGNDSNTIDLVNLQPARDSHYTQCQHKSLFAQLLMFVPRTWDPGTI
jgi:hypothetical protein